MAAHQAPPSLGFSRQEHRSGLPFPSPMHESEKWKWSRSVMSDSSRPHGLQPTRLLCPWDFPGKSTEVGCHCLLHCPWWVKPKTRLLHNPITQTQSTNIVLTIKMTKHPPFLLKLATDAALPITLFTVFHSSSIIDKIHSLRIICISWQHTVQSCFLFLEPFSKAPNTSLNLIINLP